MVLLPLRPLGESSLWHLGAVRLRRSNSILLPKTASSTPRRTRAAHPCRAFAGGRQFPDGIQHPPTIRISVAWNIFDFFGPSWRSTLA